MLCFVLANLYIILNRYNSCQMSYFQKHYLRASQGPSQAQNIKPVQSLKVRKSTQPQKTYPVQQFPKQSRGKQAAQINNFNEVIKMRNPLNPKPQTNKQVFRGMEQKHLPSLMLQGDNSMQELLNSSINQFTKYLSDRDPFQEEHQLLKEQNQSLKAALERLKIIIKQKLEHALNKQREELNAVMQDYVQLITKLLSDKEDLTTTLQNLESQLSESQSKCQELEKSNNELNSKMEEMGKQRQQHIAKTKQQIDDFLQIIEQYQQEAQQEGKQVEQLKQKISHLQKQLSSARKNQNEPSQTSNVPPKTQALLQLLQKAQEQNKYLREELKKSSQHEEWQTKIENLEKEHEQQFVEYQRAMRETLNKKDQCIARLSSIIESFRSQKG